MTETQALTVLGVLILGAGWATTGHDPLYMLAVGAIRLRAGIYCVFWASRRFISYYQSNYKWAVKDQEEQVRWRGGKI